MSESQNIEYKSSWRDEYLKWICGFANANGGSIFIGIDDKGKIIGIENVDKLLEDIPNKVRDILGVMVDVNLHTHPEGSIIEILVDAYPNPVSYKGQYHYRSGSTRQELKGMALDKFLLQKRGRRWDGVPIPAVTVNDLKQETLSFFRIKGFKSQRMSEDDLKDTKELLLENLNLIENNRLKRSAILLFHPNPERYVTGAYIKIGYFESDTDLRYQDEIHGNLFEQIEKAIDLLFTKYIRAEISYEGIYRIETYEYPKEAIREALLNSLAHKMYEGGVPIQISVYRDKLMIWNEGRLPDDWTVNTLLSKHASRPYNPDIANAFFRSGYIESWGRGTLKIVGECQKAGLPIPIFTYTAGDITVEFKKDIYYVEYLNGLDINSRQITALLYTKTNGSIVSADYQKLNGVGRTVATEELVLLVKKRLLLKEGSIGRSSRYMLPVKI